MAGRTWRRTGTAVAVALLALSLAACNRGTSSTSTEGGGEAGGKIAAVIKGLDNPFFQAMQQGIEEQATAQGTPVTVQAATSITDTTGQADQRHQPGPVAGPGQPEEQAHRQHRQSS
jgi:ABC-type sugar transport system substrate-binding protein